MKSEYLLFNLIVISGPLFFGSLKKFYFLHRWKDAAISIIVAAIPFIIWDISVTNRHWFFADEYILGFRIFGLPIEEILFFFTVPYACLFTWEMVKKFSSTSKILFVGENFFYNIILFFLVFLLLASFFTPKEYTTLTLFFTIAAIVIDRVIGAKILLKKQFLFYFFLVSFFTLVFNGYLTWRPIVTYNAIYQLDFRIITIPIEDFFFGYSLLIICTSIFEKLISRKNLL